MRPSDWLSRFERDRERLARDLEALVSRESPSEDAARVTSLARWIRDVLRERGVSAETHPCPGSGEAVVASVGASRPDCLVLGHLDTVWDAGSWDGSPFRIEEDRARGPGIFDMKAGIAVALSALPALAAESSGNGTLLLVPDEEIGSHASRALTLELASRHRCVLVLEPSLDGDAKVARKGAGAFHLRFRGRAAHAGLDPEKGVSALAELSRCVLFLEGLADPSRESTVAATLARSGSRANVIPEQADLSVDARAWSAEEARRIEASIGGYRPSDPRVTINVSGGFDRPPFEQTPESGALYERARDLGRRLGLDLGAARAGGASDGNLTAAAGVPTLDGLGPRGGGAHARDEFVFVSDLPPRAALLAGLLAGDS